MLYLPNIQNYRLFSTERLHSYSFLLHVLMETQTIQTTTAPGRPKATAPPPAPYVVEPSGHHHTHTFILLHGLGSNGETFGRALLETGIGSDQRGLAAHFPGAKFVFPTARRRRSTAFRRSMLTQWFDVASLDDPSDRNHKQLPGLRESFREILALLESESYGGGIPRENIVLGGLSQGCAMALVFLLALDESESVGGFVGMSGWLPFQAEMEARVGEGEGVTNGTATNGTVANARAYVRELLQWTGNQGHGQGSQGDPGRETKVDIRSTPVFLGHGEADDKIKVSLGEDARRTLCRLGFDVEWQVYTEQGHWYKVPDEIDDVVRFVVETCRWAS